MAEIVPSSNIVAINQVKASVDRSPFLYYNDIGQYWTDLGAVASLESTINSITYCGSGIVIFVNDTRHVVRSIYYGITSVDLVEFGVSGNAVLSSAYC